MSNLTDNSPDGSTPVQAAGTGHQLSDDQRQQFWVKVEAADPQRAAWATKRPPRLSYDRADVAVRATHPGGGSTLAKVYAHDLSSGGMSFVQQGYLHVGTTVTVTLPKRLSGEDVVAGRVAWCQHVGGTWHATGIKFNDPISPKPFVSPAEWERLPSTNPIRPETLVGQVLMIDDQDVDRMLFAHLLRRTKLTVTGVADVQQAEAALRGVVFDVVCVDLNLGVGKARGEDGVTAVRSAGHRGPIVVVSGATAARLEALRTGPLAVEHTLAKPYDAEQLMTTLAAALEVGGVDEADLIYSDLSQQDGLGDLLTTFCDRVGAAMREFRQHVRAGRLDDVHLVCDMLRGSAGGYGYPALSTAATAAIKALDGTGDVGESAPDLQRLSDLCKRLTPARRTRSAA